MQFAKANAIVNVWENTTPESDVFRLAGAFELQLAHSYLVATTPAGAPVLTLQVRPRRYEENEDEDQFDWATIASFSAAAKAVSATTKLIGNYDARMVISSVAVGATGILYFTPLPR